MDMPVYYLNNLDLFFLLFSSVNGNVNRDRVKIADISKTNNLYLQLLKKNMQFLVLNIYMY